MRTFDREELGCRRTQGVGAREPGILSWGPAVIVGPSQIPLLSVSTPLWPILEPGMGSAMTTLRTYTLAALMLLAPASLAQHAQDVGLAADPAIVDFGDAFDGEVLRRVVTFKNVTSEPWEVQSVQTSCGCTVAKVKGPSGEELVAKPAKPVPVVTLQPGQEITVDVEFSTIGQRGQVEKHLKVFNMDPVVPPTEVAVRARVAKGISVTPTMVNFNAIPKSGVQERTVVFESIEIGPWTITGFESGLPGWEIPEYVRFEILGNEGPKREVKVVLAEGRAVGSLSGRINAVVDHERIKAVPFYVQALVRPDVTFSSGNEAFPEAVTFDKVAPDETVTRTLSIKNADAEVPYVLEEVELQTKNPEFFETAIREIEPGVEYAVDVTASGAIAESGSTFFRGNLLLKAKHPDLPTKTIPFHGWVRRDGTR